VSEQHAAEDHQIKMVDHPEKTSISKAVNSALEIARGEFVVLLNNQDLLTEDALFWLADAINVHPQAGMFYSDEDKIDEANRLFAPYCKTEWNPFLFLGHNLITHFGCFRTALVQDLGGFHPDYEGAQDYDLAARMAERLLPANIVHIPRILYHCRVTSSTSCPNDKPHVLENIEKAINAHLDRQNLRATATTIAATGMQQIRFQLPPDSPVASILIPTKNREDLLRVCISSILSKTVYPHYEILVIDNGSDCPATLTYFDELARNPQIRILHDDGPFNFSRLNNRAVAESQGSVVLLLNNDTEVLAPDWLEAMIALATLPQIGAVGAKLLFPDGTIQHGGVILGLGSCASHAHTGFTHDAMGYCGRAQLLQMMSAVTGACLAVRKTVYEEVGGLDEEELPVAFNDLDFCLKLRERGYWNVWTPQAVLVHHESISRGYEVTVDKKQRYYNEMSIIKKRWPTHFYNDPAYNPNLSLNKAGDFSLARHPRIALGSRHNPKLLPPTLICPPQSAPHLLLASGRDSDTNSPRMIALAESLRTQGTIASYTCANRNGVWAISPGATGWFDGICLEGDPSGMYWFQQSVMKRLPYLVDWNEEIGRAHV
jgi:GT2 family glycosyltransferase